MRVPDICSASAVNQMTQQWLRKMKGRSIGSAERTTHGMCGRRGIGLFEGNQRDVADM
jgi:hypothetical protein